MKDESLTSSRIKSQNGRNITRSTPARVSPEWIAEQRRLGWPDMHPEDFCHRCGARNPSWATGPWSRWREGTAAWAAETGREGICCPTCFAVMHEESTGKRVLWALVPYTEEIGRDWAWKEGDDA